MDFSNLQKQYEELKKEAKKIDETDDFVNDGKLRNSGLEFELTGHIINKKDGFFNVST